jgi:hypothetical protein
MLINNYLANSKRTLITLREKIVKYVYHNSFHLAKIEIGHMMKTLKGLPIYYKYIRSSFHARMAQHEIQGVH